MKKVRKCSQFKSLSLWNQEKEFHEILYLNVSIISLWVGIIFFNIISSQTIDTPVGKGGFKSIWTQKSI